MYVPEKVFIVLFLNQWDWTQIPNLKKITLLAGCEISIEMLFAFGRRVSIHLKCSQVDVQQNTEVFQMPTKNKLTQGTTANHCFFSEQEYVFTNVYISLK